MPLINGTECEPYITADDTLMQCQADELIEGAQILAHIVSAESILIGIEDNKPDAIASVEAAIARSGAEIELAIANSISAPDRAIAASTLAMASGLLSSIPIRIDSAETICARICAPSISSSAWHCISVSSAVM